MPCRHSIGPYARVIDRFHRKNEILQFVCMYIIYLFLCNWMPIRFAAWAFMNYFFFHIANFITRNHFLQAIFTIVLIYSRHPKHWKTPFTHLTTRLRGYVLLKGVAIKRNRIIITPFERGRPVRVYEGTEFRRVRWIRTHTDYSFFWWRLTTPPREAIRDYSWRWFLSIHEVPL